jgi:hypothetical protein
MRAVTRPSQIALCVFIVANAFLLSGCRAHPNSPEGVVRKMYDAIQEREQDKYIDCLAPQSRMKPGFFFWEQMIRAGAGLFRVGAPDLTEVICKALRFQTVDNSSAPLHPASFAQNDTPLLARRQPKAAALPGLAA